MWGLNMSFLSEDILCNQNASWRIIWPASSAHLCDIVPHAPCLLVRMLRIFCFSWFAVTWSLCLAALMRWSHIFSSSLRSAAYWAQLDWRRVGGGWINRNSKKNKTINVRDEEMMVHGLFVCLAFRQSPCIVRRRECSKIAMEWSWLSSTYAVFTTSSFICNVSPK